jgi:hypothetical protein
VGTAVKRVLVVGPNAGCVGNATDCFYGFDDSSKLSPVSAQKGGAFGNNRVITVLEAINSTTGLTVTYSQVPTGRIISFLP